MSTPRFSSDTMANPRRKCKVITVRSRRIVEEAPPSQSNQDEVATKEPETKKEEETLAPSSPKQVLKLYVPQALYPQRLRKDGKDNQFSRFLEIFKKLQINIPFAEALEQMLLYAKFLKELMTRKRNWGEKETIVLTEECSATIQKKLLQKMKDPGSFPIPCIIGDINIEKALCNLGASINLIGRFVGETGRVHLPADFVVLDMEEEANTSIILGRPFLVTAGAIIDVQKGELVLRLHEERIVFNVFKAMSYPKESIGECMMVDTIEDLVQRVLEEEQCEVITKQDQQAPCGELPLETMERPIMLDKTSNMEVETPKLELKALPPSLKYAYLGDNNTYPMIINSSLNEQQEEELIQVLKQHKVAIGWTLADLKGISPSMCMHKILLEKDYVSKWVEAIATATNDNKVMISFLRRNIFSRFGVPRALISDGGTHFNNK
ncbi:uncharacterized protein LOC107615530 [Arachis ipaensis]|uniref:uncharacterized protein LOC107615530 n=1 Tax=Arachis ipaensis TaxID=130454 RepID=UPI000A2B1840|nr:uncharacterized protein LOC107615530 [Arachis ipaensis]